MSPSLPQISGAEAIRAPEKLGFVVARQKRSHVVLRRGSSGCVVTNHREIIAPADVGRFAPAAAELHLWASKPVMNYVFRAPKFPLLLDIGSELVHAKTRSQFAKRVAALELRGNQKLAIIDRTA